MFFQCLEIFFLIYTHPIIFKILTLNIPMAIYFKLYIVHAYISSNNFTLKWVIVQIIVSVTD